MIYEIIEHRVDKGVEVSERLCYVDNLEQATLIILKLTGWAWIPSVKVGKTYIHIRRNKKYTVEEFE